MKRFILFMFTPYLYGGGLNDFVGSYETEKEVLEKIENTRSWDVTEAHILDTFNGHKRFFVYDHFQDENMQWNFVAPREKTNET